MNDKDIERFWSRVDKTPDCWIWTMPNQNRARFGIGSQRFEAYRIAYELSYGPTPPDMVLHHTCGNPLCVRPDHLAIDTTYIARQHPIDTLIPLTRGMFTQVSPEDHSHLMKWKWLYNPVTHRAYRGEKRNGKSIPIYMHREILNAPQGVHVDHINGDRLDNRRENLRLASVTENRRNTRKVYKDGITTSVYKGVSLHKRTQRWIAKITINRQAIQIGRFREEITAAKAYDQAAKTLFGAFARLNFPEGI